MFQFIGKPISLCDLHLQKADRLFCFSSHLFFAVVSFRFHFHFCRLLFSFSPLYLKFSSYFILRLRSIIIIFIIIIFTHRSNDTSLLFHFIKQTAFSYYYFFFFTFKHLSFFFSIYCPHENYFLFKRS